MLEHVSAITEQFHGSINFSQLNRLQRHVADQVTRTLM